MNEILLERITLDLDKKNKTEILAIIYKIFNILPFNDIEYLLLKRSNKKNNYHCVLWLNKELTPRKSLNLRLKLEDDRNRVAIDRIRDEPLGTLFTTYEKIPKKRKRKV